MFKSIFNKTEYTPELQPYAPFKMLNGYEDYFTPWSGVSYDDATVRTCIDTIATNVAKLRPKHIRKMDGKTFEMQDNLDNLLGLRPNEYMNTYDFIYKIVTQLYCYNNAFVYIKFGPSGEVLGLYPLDYETVELRELNNVLYVRFMFMQAGYITIPYTEIIHLRRHFNGNSVFGESNEAPLTQPLSILNTVKQALVNAVKNSTKLRGYLKANANLRDEDQKSILASFIEKITSTDAGNDSGIAIVDNKMDYHQLTSDIKTADATQMDSCRQDVYRYFRLSEALITSNYKEEEWNAFYESVIEPLAIQMGLEFTSKLFTDREKGFGNEVIFTADRLNYASTKAKVSLVQAMQPVGWISKNEARALFGWAPTPDGDKFQVSLNYVDSTKQNKYQVGENTDSTDNTQDGEDNENM
jgi:HK97 family phage portal protein